MKWASEAQPCREAVAAAGTVWELVSDAHQCGTARAWPLRSGSDILSWPSFRMFQVKRSNSYHHAHRILRLFRTAALTYPP